MAVKKSLLEQKTNQELEEYIKLETTFVPQASKIAFDILKTRGREFSEEEINTIHLLTNKKEEKKIIVIHPNNIKSSNLIYLSFFLSLIVFLLLLSPELLNNSSNFLSNLFSTLFAAFLAALVRRGYNWVKFLLLISCIINSLFIPFIIQLAQLLPLITILSIFVLYLQIYAMILLFKIPKESPLGADKSNLK